MRTGPYEYQSEFARRHQAVGREQALRETLVRVLNARFGPVGPEAEARVAEAPVTDLGRLIELVVTASSLEDVFTP